MGDMGDGDEIAFCSGRPFMSETFSSLVSTSRVSVISSMIPCCLTKDCLLLDVMETTFSVIMVVWSFSEKTEQICSAMVFSEPMALDGDTLVSTLLARVGVWDLLSPSSFEVIRAFDGMMSFLL